MLELLKLSAKFIEDKTDGFKPEIGIILGTGLGALVDEVDVKFILSYTDIPHFPVSTVESHSGRLIFGELSGKKVIVMQGRFHYYEGYTMKQVVFPVRIMKLLGIKCLFLSNACGSVNPEIKTGDLMIIDDHINLFPDNPLTGPNIDELGPRFPDMSEPYSRQLISKARRIAEENGINIHQGIYAALPGPNLETRAEYRYLRTIGADVVGMSTIPEVIAATHMGISCFAISVITDEGWHDVLEKVTLQMVIEAANKAQPQLTTIMKNLCAEV